MSNPKMISRLGAVLGTAIIPMEGKRPIVLDRVIALALRALGVNDVEGRAPAVREAIARRLMDELGDVDAERVALQAEIRELRKKVERLEARVEKEGVVLSEKEMSEIRTLVSYGLTRLEAGEVYGVSEAVVRSVLAGKGQARVLPERPVGRPQKRGRAIEL